MLAGETFTWPLPLGVDSRPHVIGDPKCPNCCGCGDGNPEPCEECGGLLHAALDDEVEVGDDWRFVHSYRCDRPCSCFYCPEPQP